MKISVVFDSMEEFQRYMIPNGSAHWDVSVTDVARPEVIPFPEPVEEPTLPEPETPDEDYRLKVRAKLAKLNKQAGNNKAKELIQGFGVERLTDVSLEDLPELMKRAEEALNA